MLQGMAMRVASSEKLFQAFVVSWFKNFQFFCMKNIEKANLVQHKECAAPKRMSKYTKTIQIKIIHKNWLFLSSILMGMCLCYESVRDQVYAETPSNPQKMPRLPFNIKTNESLFNLLGKF